MRKRFIAAITALLLLAGSASASIPLYLEPDEYQGRFYNEPEWLESGDYRYILRDDGTAEIVAFYGSEKVLTIPSELSGKRVTAIGDDAFYSNSDIVRVIIPDSVVSIESNPFVGCRYLERFEVSPEHPAFRTVGGVLFSKADRRLVSYPSALKAHRYVIPQGVEMIGRKAFCGWFIGYCSEPRDGYYSSTDADFSVSRLTEVVLPDGVRRIEDGAFAFCSDLTRVRMPDSVAEIADNAFRDCGRVAFEAGANPCVNQFCAVHGFDCVPMAEGDAIEAEAWVSGEVINCDEWISLRSGPSTQSERLAKIPLGERVEVVPSLDEFCRCRFGDAVGYVPVRFLRLDQEAVETYYDSGDYSYILRDDGTAEITGYSGEEQTVNVPRQLDGRPVSAIGKGAFSECFPTERIVIPEGIVEIGDKAFFWCQELSEVVLPDGLVSIGDCAFVMCWQLEKINIPDSVTSIGANPFARVDAMPQIAMSPDHPMFELVDGVLFDKPGKRLIAYLPSSAAESYAIPEGTEVIGDNAFLMASNLREVTVPDSVKTVGVEAFHHCDALDSIVLPEGVTVIGWGAFRGCWHLTEAVLPETLTCIGENAFSYRESELHINLPKRVSAIGDDIFWDSDKQIVTVSPNSYAQAYCEKRGLSYVLNDDSGDSADGDWRPATVAYCDEWISLRAEPSKSAKKLAEVPLGAQVLAYPSEGEFCACRYEGMTGYVLRRYLKWDQGGADADGGRSSLSRAEEAPVVVPDVAEFLTLRNESGATIDTIRKDERLKVLGWDGKSCRVQRIGTGQVGYVHSGYIMAEGLEYGRWPYDYEALKGDLEALPKDCPAVAETLAQTADGREVIVVRYGDENADHHILIQCGIHAREIMTSQLGGDMIRALADDYPSGIEGVCIHILPLVNPDGQAVALYGASALRDADLAAQVGRWITGDGHGDWKANANGVDLNRNFDEGWEQLKVRTPGAERYRGPAPHSEAETRALADYTARYPFDCTISVHSYASLIYWKGAPDAIRASTESLAERVSASTAYPLSTSEVGLDRGGYRDWALIKAGIPSITVEIGAVDSMGSLEEYSAIALRFRSFIPDLTDWVRNQQRPFPGRAARSDAGESGNTVM